MSSQRIKAFAYVTAEKAALYSSIMRVFMQSCERFRFHLRPLDVLESLPACSGVTAPDQPEIESALAQLCDWGNLEAHPDAAEVRSVEDFYKQRYVFRMTGEGQAAERALNLFLTTSEHQSGLPINTLIAIRSLLRNLTQLSKEGNPAPVKIYEVLITLRDRFEDLTYSTQTFMAGLQRKIDLQLAQTEQFTSQTERLIAHVEGFVAELMIASDDIAETLREIKAGGVERLLEAAAAFDTVDRMGISAEDGDHAVAAQRSFWERLEEWFLSLPGRPSHAESLRGRARASLPALLSLITSINDQRINRIDRSNDLRVLARWFATSASDADAHRLWRIVFGLGAARHLIVDDATLDQHEAEDSLPDLSWFDAPPLRISQPLRVHGSYSRTGRLRPIIDRTAEKEKLAAAAHEEAVRILSAQSRFATGCRMRLSELDQLEAGEFDIFLDFLGEAMSANVFSGDAAEILSNDGCLRVKLEPTLDGRTAGIHTPEGFFSGPDHWISVERISVAEVIK